MYQLQIPKLQKNQIAVVVHYPPAENYPASAVYYIVNQSGDWLSRVEARLGEHVRLYDDGRAFLGLGSYSRSINGRWEKFTAAELANPVERVRVAPLD